MLYNDGCVMQHHFADSTPPATASLPDASTAPVAAAGHSCCTAHTGSVAATDGPSTRASTPGGLWFEPASLAAIAGSLRVLTAANCGISDPAPLAVLTRLHTLDLSANAIVSLDVLQPVLSALGCLQDLDMRRNPCTHGSSKHRDCIILRAADTLQQLDGAQVTPAHRAFLQALHSRKARAQQQQHTAQHLEHHHVGGMSPRDRQHAEAGSSGGFTVAGCADP